VSLEGLAADGRNAVASGLKRSMKP